jgi:hypothetical protein
MEDMMLEIGTLATQQHSHTNLAKRLITTALLLGTTGCCTNFSAPRIPKVHLWFTSSVGQGDLPTAAKWFSLVWELS